MILDYTKVSPPPPRTLARYTRDTPGFVYSLSLSLLSTCSFLWFLQLPMVRPMVRFHDDYYLQGGNLFSTVLVHDYRVWLRSYTVNYSVVFCNHSIHTCDPRGIRRRRRTEYTDVNTEIPFSVGWICVVWSCKASDYQWRVVHSMWTSY